MRLLSWSILFAVGIWPVAWFLWRALQGEANAVIAVGSMMIGTFGGLLFLVSQIYMQTTEFGVTTQRIIFKSGVISRYTNEIPLSSLENVNLHQSIFSRIFGYGKLEINGSGGSGVWTPPVQDPVSLRAVISEARIATEAAPRFMARPRHIDQAHNNDRRSSSRPKPNRPTV
ncbi:PH domain-containing protein [Parvularcula maris]|uniref:PH domain-containing protein n=1 Tax=Parvularcula maris TaxID=2965077 RepID=UPI002113B61A|nr:PH domain-containing protein [Parvularcula maris]